MYGSTGRSHLRSSTCGPQEDPVLLRLAFVRLDFSSGCLWRTLTPSGSQFEEHVFRPLDDDDYDDGGAPAADNGIRAPGRCPLSRPRQVGSSGSRHVRLGRCFALFKTVDGGVSWSAVTPPHFPPLQPFAELNFAIIRFADIDDGWAWDYNEEVGGTGYQLLATHDGGGNTLDADHARTAQRVGDRDPRRRWRPRMGSHFRHHCVGRLFDLR